MPGFCGRRRAYQLCTLALVPVDHELAGQSVYGSEHVSYARVIESPSAAIELPVGAAADAEGSATATAATSTANTVFMGSLLSLGVAPTLRPILGTYKGRSRSPTRCLPVSPRTRARR